MTAFVWEYLGDQWSVVYGVMQSDEAYALADWIRDPSDEDYNPRPSCVFEFEMAGVVVSFAEFSALKPRSWGMVRGRPAYVTQRLSPAAVEVYYDDEIAYGVVVAPLHNKA